MHGRLLRTMHAYTKCYVAYVPMAIWVITMHQKLPESSKRPPPFFGSKSCKRPWAYTWHFMVIARSTGFALLEKEILTKYGHYGVPIMAYHAYAVCFFAL